MLWQKIVEYGKQLFTVMQKQAKHDEAIKEVRQDIKDLRQDFNNIRQEVNDLSRIVERLAFELQKDRENAARDREMQQLRLENICCVSSAACRPVKTTMKMTYDAHVDILYIRLEGAQIVESDEAEEGVVVDCDANGKIVGVEIQDASDYVQALKSRELSQAGSAVK